ncbi:hypothetical protein J1N35_000854, partial [Gossypium stocksii]
EMTKKERELEHEIEKEMIEKEDRDQEKVSNAFTNQHDSKDSINKFQLRYLSNEKGILLIEKGFESWAFVVQNYNSRMFHDSGSFPSKNEGATSSN